MPTQNVARPSIIVSEQELVDLMSARRGAKMESITSSTEPKLKPGHPFAGLLKFSNVNVVTNADYEHSVNLQRGREGKEMDFEAQQTWGRHVDGTPFVAHKPKGATAERLYLPVHVRRANEPPVYKDAGRTVDTATVRPWLADRHAEGARQEVDNPVVYRRYLLANITSLVYGGVRYIVDHHQPAAVPPAPVEAAA